MRSIKHRMNNIQNTNPGLSSYQYFKLAVTSQRFTRQVIARNFNELVEKDDYDKTIKKDLLAELYAFSNRLEDNQK